MNTKQRDQAVKEIIESSEVYGPNDLEEYQGCINFNHLQDAIERAGYTLEAHQKGIQGTFLCLRKI